MLSYAGFDRVASPSHHIGLLRLTCLPFDPFFLAITFQMPENIYLQLEILETLQEHQTVRQERDQAEKARRDAIAALHRRKQELLAPYVQTLDGFILAADASANHLAVVELDEISELLAAATGRNVHLALPVITGGITVTFTADEARKAGAKINMSGKDATLSACIRPSNRVQAPGFTKWKNGKPKSYIRATNYNYVRSVGMILSPTLFDFIFHTTRKQCRLSVGYSFIADANGKLAIIQDSQPSVCYRPTAGELIAKTFPQNCTQQVQTRQPTAG